MPYAFDPELLPLVDLLPAPNLEDLDAARGALDEILATINGSIDTSGLTITDHHVPGPDGAPDVVVRVYVPSSAAPPTGRPAILDIHGGGFVTGSIEMEHGICAPLARSLDAVVVTVEYRLAPEHPFPAGLEDCYVALQWLAGAADELGIDDRRIAVHGQSAGGGLAAALALLTRDRGGPPLCFQVLGIPELDHRLETVSMRTFVDTPLWNRPNAERSWAMYLGTDGSDPVSPYASPAIATDLTGLPPAYVTAMEFDPLRDEGIVYAARLLEAGVSVELHVFPGTFHGSAVLDSAEVSRRGATELTVALRKGLGVGAGT